MKKTEYCQKMEYLDTICKQVNEVNLLATKRVENTRLVNGFVNLFLLMFLLIFFVNVPTSLFYIGVQIFFADVPTKNSNQNNVTNSIC